MRQIFVDDCFYEIRNGANIKQGIVDGGFPITRIETISNDKFNRERMGYAGIDDLEKYAAFVLDDDDLLMSHINSVQYLGRTVLYKKDKDESIIHGMNLLRLRPNKEIINPAYIRYYFSSRKFRDSIAKITKKSVNQASFTVADLKKIVIDLPDLQRQENIANILSRLEIVKEFRNYQLEELDHLVKSRFVEMFGDPVSNPFNWRKDKLSHIGNLGRGVSKHRPRNAPELLGGQYPLIQTGDVANADLYITEYKSTYSELGLKQSKLWKKGTLCITIAANIAKTSILSFDACFPDSVVGFAPNENTNNIFMHYWFAFFQQLLESQAPESAQKNINLKILSDLNVIVPPKEEQDQFEVFVHCVDKLKCEVRKSLNEVEKLFDSLMQECFE